MKKKKSPPSRANSDEDLRSETLALARKYAEEALRESEANLKLAADSADAGLWSLGAGSDQFWVTEKTRSLFQFPPDQPVTVDRFLAVIHPEDRERIRRTLAEALREMREVRDEYRIVHPDGSVRWIMSRGRPRIGPSGELDRLAGISTDITERRILREQLESRLRFETLLAELSAGFVNLPPGDVDGAISDAQRRLCEVLGLERSSLWEPDPENPHDFRMTRIFDLDSGPTHKAIGASAGRFFPWILEQMRRGELVAIAKLDELPAEAAIDKESFRRLNTTASVIVPLLAGGVLFGTLTFAMIRREQAWPEGLLKRFRLVAQLFANALARKNAEQELRHSLEEIEKLKLRLEKENIYLREEIEAERGIDEIVGQNPAMKDLLSQAEQVARTDSTVLILGETGTGKELLARAIHKMSARQDRPLITVSCAALAPTLIESELFGREKGAYTGALTKMIGRFEIADGSTLFLDEVGEIPLELQSKLLRVLEEGTFERLGSTKTLHVNVRVIAATNRDLEQEAKDGRFRKDLFYRLNVFPMTIPPLRERPKDIPLLVWAFVREFQRRMGKEIEAISKKSMDALQAYSWPGNVRELRNVVEHAMILNRSENLVIHAPGMGSPEAGATPNLRKMEREHILRVLDQAGWRIAGPGGAAEALGLTRSTLYSKMKKLQIHRPSS